MKAWDPSPGELPPVEPYTGTAAPPRELTPEEKLRRRRDYRFNHERHASHVIRISTEEKPV